jgi:excisionase family DNA binding protein
VEKPGQVLDIDSLARYLRIPKSTLYQLVRAGRIPCHKVGRQWRFRKDAIDEWLDRPEALDSGSGRPAR